MSSSQPTGEAIGAGLDIDRLQPPDIETFLRGLPRRVAGSIAIDPPPDESAESEAGRADRAERIARVVERLQDIVDGIDRLIERIGDGGYGLDPDEPGAAPARPEGLPATIVAHLERIETGATEAARRLAGLPTSAWESDPDLIGAIRAAVVELVSRLRALQAEAPQNDDR